MSNGSETKGNALQAAMKGLAVVGFLALLIGGVLLAVYAARLVPQTLSRLGSAVYLSGTTGTTTPAKTNTTTGTETPTSVATSTPTTPVVTPPKTTTGGGTRTVVRQVTPTLYGLPDLTIEVLEVGYLRTSSATSFVEDNEVPDGKRAAIRFRVKNIGTNAVSGTWRVEVEYPAEGGDEKYTLTNSDLLMPNGYKDFTFGFDNPDTGRNREFNLEVDPQDRIDESNERNNDDSAEVDVED